MYPAHIHTNNKKKRATNSSGSRIPTKKYCTKKGSTLFFFLRPDSSPQIDASRLVLVGMSIWDNKKIIKMIKDSDDSIFDYLLERSAASMAALIRAETVTKADRLLPVRSSWMASTSSLDVLLLGVPWPDWAEWVLCSACLTTRTSGSFQSLEFCRDADALNCCWKCRTLEMGMFWTLSSSSSSDEEELDEQAESRSHAGSALLPSDDDADGVWTSGMISTISSGSMDDVGGGMAALDGCNVLP